MDTSKTAGTASSLTHRENLIISLFSNRLACDTMKAHFSPEAFINPRPARSLSGTSPEPRPCRTAPSESESNWYAAQKCVISSAIGFRNARFIGNLHNLSPSLSSVEIQAAGSRNVTGAGEKAQNAGVEMVKGYRVAAVAEHAHCTIGNWRPPAESSAAKRSVQRIPVRSGPLC